MDFQDISVVMTRSFLKWLTAQIVHMIPVVLFFFIAFTLVDITRILAYRTEQEAYYSFGVIFIASCVMGKVVVLSDHLQFTHAFSKKPLIYSTLWKTCVYVLASFFVLIIDHLVPAFLEHKSMGEIFQKIGEDLQTWKFWIGLMWLTVLLLIYVASRELIVAVGEKRVFQLFFISRK